MTVVEPDRRTRILDYAAPLFAEKGINGSTVRGIANGVGMLSGSLYHYFDSKDDMVRAIVVRYLDILMGRYRAALDRRSEPREALQALVQTSLEVALEHHHASQIYQTNRDYFATGDTFEEVRRLATAVHETWASVIDDGVRSGAFRNDLNPRMFHRFLRDAVFLAPRWYRSDDGHEVAEVADEIIGVFLGGFSARPA